MKYITKFENHSAYSAAESSLVEPNVSYCVNENEVHYKPIVSTLNEAFIRPYTDGNYWLVAESGRVVLGTIQGSTSQLAFVSNDGGNTFTTTNFPVERPEYAYFGGVYETTVIPSGSNLSFTVGSVDYVYNGATHVFEPTPMPYAS